MTPHWPWAWHRRIWQGNVADRRWCGRIEQLPGTCDIGLAARAGEEAVVTDAVKALRKNVEQEAADEFVRVQCHGTLAIGAVAAIILVAERDPMLVQRDQPAVRDGDAVGVSRQIGEHRFRPGERWLGGTRPSASCAAAPGDEGRHVVRSSRCGHRRTGDALRHAAAASCRGTTARTALPAHEPATGTEREMRPSVLHRARYSHRVRSCGCAGDASWPSPSCGGRR